MRFLHILEPSWNDGKEKQLIGRCVRFNSHAELPEKERNVDIKKYFSLKRERKSVDLYVSEISMKNKELKEKFSDLVKRSAVDCELFRSQNMLGEDYKCFHFSEDTYIGYIEKKETMSSYSLNFDTYNNDGLFSNN